MQCERKKEARTGGRGYALEIIDEAYTNFRLERAYRRENKEQQYKGNIERSLGFPTTQMSHSQRGSVDLDRSSFETLIAGESYCSSCF